MRTLSLFYIISFACILSFSSCDTNNRINIEDYYFPIDELKEGRVYEYRNNGERGETSSRYKYYNTIHTDSAQYLISNHYGPTFFNDQYVLSEVVSNGILAKEFRFMAIIPEQEEQSIVKAEIIKDNAFPFSVSKEGGVTAMEIKFTDPRNSKEKIRLIRERQYLGDTIFTFKGIDLPAIIVASNEIMEFTHEDDGDFDNTTFATEIYAKGIGLVARKFNMGNVELESVLHDTFSMKKLESLASEYWGKEININPIK